MAMWTAAAPLGEFGLSATTAPAATTLLERLGLHSVTVEARPSSALLARH
jgi:hypothetical protein